MSDARTRELERRWRRSGSQVDEVAWLVARLRLGELAPQRVQLASQLGHAGAEQALQEVGEAAAKHFDDWMQALRGAGAEVLVRVLIAALRAAMARVQVSEEDQRFLARLEDWARCPCERHLERARGACPVGRPRGRAWSGGVLESVLRFAGQLLALADRPDARALSALTSAVYQASKLTSGIRAPIRAEVVPWLLGYADPLAAG